MAASVAVEKAADNAADYYDWHHEMVILISWRI